MTDDEKDRQLAIAKEKVRASINMLLASHGWELLPNASLRGGGTVVVYHLKRLDSERVIEEPIFLHELLGDATGSLGAAKGMQVRLAMHLLVRVKRENEASGA